MKAAVFQGPGLLHKIEDMPMPLPGPHEVVIEVERCGICGSDVSGGKAPADDKGQGASFGSIYRPGAILGHEIGGRVVELGSAVERLKVGDRIAPLAISGCSTCVDCLSGNPVWCRSASMLMGGYAQYALASEFHSPLLPPELTLDCGALVEPMATSLHAVSLAELRPNARVVVLGVGALGLGIVHFARMAGAGMIAAVARSESREPLARAMGADFYVTQRPRLARELADLMGGPADVVFEAAGAPGLIAQAISCVRPRGRIVSAGISTEAEANFHKAAIMKEVQIQYATAYSVADCELVVRQLRDPDCPLARLVSKTTSLDTFPEVFDELCHGAVQAKVIVDPWKAAE